MVQEITEFGSSVQQAAADHGVAAPTVRKWLGRYLVGGAPALADASSRPTRSPRSIAPATALLIVELRQQRLLQRQIARQAGVSASTVIRVLNVGRDPVLCSAEDNVSSRPILMPR
ncbi:hypothetical protein WI38_33270 [Burkholderia ubonensis]|uniref:Transposase n=1 Tax=Burkholderia ubonensis TaxID=101571 RepID=A0A102K8C7_9BURK|nr:hypothetical protein WI35_15065 [Burkholderia ubonensis]KUZ81044.1 hypothetical protein WI38_33270 [Burkholderia ubonensis]KUZ99721.1 hypothetical protein WI39_05895 [Burkholderia ubonensis]KVC65493.1 hypothetical protein WI72_33490 [Burkholderia ubonensis]KVD94558.1 hypothetical protein WI90_07545 [Burkholderia ubonensis]